MPHAEQVAAIRAFGAALAQVPPPQQSVLIADQFCRTFPEMDVTPAIPLEQLQEWAAPATKCVVPNLPPLPSTDGSGNANVGYRFEVTARNQIGTSPGGTNPTPMLSVVGVPGVLDPVYPRVWFPYWDPSSTTRPSKPIIDISTTAGGPAITVDIPGYVSVPMGHLRVSNDAGNPIGITGGVVAARFETTDVRDPLPFGYVPSLVMQRTVRLVATAGNITSTAIVRINSDTSYGVVRWVTGPRRS